MRELPVWYMRWYYSPKSSSMYIWYSEILAIFFSQNNVVPIWIEGKDYGFGSGVYNETAGRWTHLFGKVNTISFY